MTYMEAMELFDRSQVDADLEQGYIDSVLASNMDKNFVRRIAEPEGTPALPMPEDDRGGRMGWGSHLMSSGANDQGGIVYPGIIQRDENSPLERLSQQDARNYARDTKQYIQFPTDQDALWFGQNYKKASGWR